jgi:two-component system OmpR family response regulator
MRWLEMDRQEPASTGFAETGYRFGGFRLHADGTLSRGGTPVSLAAKELTALRLLLANRGRVVAPRELKNALWGGEHATTESVARCIASLRKHLEPEECIESVYKRGYRFSAEATVLGSLPAAFPPRLAILPFATGFGVPEYLGSSLADQAGTRLNAGPHPDLSILAKDSVFALCRQGLSVREIGEQLKADLVLSGAVQGLPAHWRLHAEITRVEDGSCIWSEDRLVERTRLAGLETELVNLVIFRIGGLGLSVSASVEAEQEAEQPTRREAYEIFTRARYDWQSLERHRMQDALQQLLHAIDMDPALTAARVDLANLCVMQAVCGFMEPQVAADIVRRFAEAAQEIPAGAEALMPALGWLRFHVERNLPAALTLFAHSAHLPHDPWTTRVRTLFALSRHRFGEAIELLESAIRRDPCSAWLQARLAWAHHLTGDAAVSHQLARTALDRFPHHEGTQIYGAMILSFQGEADRAVNVAQALAQRMPYLDAATAVHAYALAMAGCESEARVILERLQWLSRERYVMNTFAPAVYVALGEFDKALAGLRVSSNHRCPWFFQMLADPRLGPLREQPEFQAMLGELAGMEAEAERGTAEG